MRDRYIPPFEIKTLEQLIRVFGSWNHHAEPGGAWRLYSKEEHDDSPSRRDGVGADIEARYKKLLVTLIWKVAEALNSYACLGHSDGAVLPFFDFSKICCSPMVTIAAAAILLQRFYGERSFVRNDKLVSTYCSHLQIAPTSGLTQLLHLGDSNSLPLSCWQDGGYSKIASSHIRADVRSVLYRTLPHVSRCSQS